MKIGFKIIVLMIIINISCAQNIETDTFQVITKKEDVSRNFDELWKDYDPRKEPLDIEVLKEWEEEGVVMRVLRYRLGIFKGQKSMIAAIYGFPKGEKNLPGLVQVHGGGQYADYNAVLQNAKRGYATISISWAGRINAPDYKVSPTEVKLFWADSTEHKNYKLTTDWGALDGYHAPHRYKGTSPTSITPTAWTIDKIDSPRNNLWFLWTLAARRAITFIERQPEVDAHKIGIYGHSMGGTITTLTAPDPRIKAAAPSCGGVSISDRGSVFKDVLSDYSYLKRINCPIMFLSPSNDFHGKLYDLQKALTFIKTDNWRVTCSAHHSHQDTPEFEAANILWFDQILKNDFQYPQTPKAISVLSDNMISFEVSPDKSMPILSVDVYYWQPKVEPEEINRELRKNRFWHHAIPKQDGDKWVANLELEASNRPVWVYANVLYQLDKEVSGASYYYRTYSSKNINLSSKMTIIGIDEIQTANIQETLKGGLIIESFEGNWKKDWYTYNRKNWEYITHKINNDLWRAPSNEHILTFDVLSKQSNKMTIRMDNYATEIELKGGEWQTVSLSPSQFKNRNQEILIDLMLVKELEISSEEALKVPRGESGKPLKFGGNWKGAPPTFKNLRWKQK